MFLKVFRGVAGPILEHYKSQDIQVTKRQGIWASTLVSAAQADVENRKLAQAERAQHPILMAIYVMIVLPPALYWFLFWMDTIFAESAWSIPFLGWTIMDWSTWDLPRAPDRLEEMGRDILAIFLGGGSAVYGITKSAKILRASKIFEGK